MQIDVPNFERNYYFYSKIYKMGLAKVFGVIFCLVSFIWGTILLFSYGSKMFDNATGGTRSLADVNLLIPLLVFAIVFIFGNVLVRDRILEDHH